MKKKPFIEKGIIAKNKKAYHDYFIDKKYECGIVLYGSEVKALREGKCSIKESHAGFKDGELFLMNGHIGDYEPSIEKHQQNRYRKLLVHKRELNEISGTATKDGYTIVPLDIYFNERGIAKLTIGLACGKKKHDKRQTERDREWQRRKQRIQKGNGYE